MSLKGLNDYNNIVESTTSAEARDGDIVELIILKIGTIKSLEDQLAEYNTQQKQIGAPEVPATFKTCGLSVTVAVYSNDSKKIKYDKPKFQLKKELNFYPPRTCYDKGWNFQNKGGSNKASMYDKTKPVVVDIYPNAFEAKDFDSGMTATMIKEGQLETQYPVIIEKERLRLAQWNELLEEYKKATPLETSEFILDNFARKWFLCSVVNQVATYITPTVGLRFFAKWIVRQIQGGKSMPDIYPIEWNKNTRNFDVYSKCTVTTPTEEDVAAAQAIQTVFDSYVPKAKAKAEPEQAGF